MIIARPDPSYLIIFFFLRLSNGCASSPRASNASPLSACRRCCRGSYPSRTHRRRAVSYCPLAGANRRYGDHNDSTTATLCLNTASLLELRGSNFDVVESLVQPVLDLRVTLAAEQFSAVDAIIQPALCRNCFFAHLTPLLGDSVNQPAVFIGPIQICFHVHRHRNSRRRCSERRAARAVSHSYGWTCVTPWLGKSR